MKIKKKIRRQPSSCQPDSGPQLKKGSYVQQIEFYGNIPKKRERHTEDSPVLNYLKSLLGWK